MKKTILILILTIFSACEKTAEIENPNGIFTKSEISDLNWIINEFDQILESEYKTNVVEKAYKDYSSEVWKGLSERQSIPIPNGIDSLTRKIKKLGVFSKIWSTWKGKPEDSEIYNIGQEPYLIYLKELGKESDFIEDYAQSLSNTRDIMPSIVAGFAKNIDNIDLKDKNSRLIFSVHYLTLFTR
ncbi:hypothetical protein [Gillisia limnaea]|uniref:Uncharacterized protein n=1 Tax=Gillisia limnaea (strain DSM 15749 / LMG 21470 / R-8282) TaxID=865937 RepID=H2BXI4_GILLR|nr:hypothetical protein [Gillisia limnaea]EHQ02066.1 hypothetical protein Gilli_1408 [Gillisia limnaea DSM 15749]